MLARNSDVDSAIKSVRELEDKFNRKYKYPWTFLNEEPFSDDFKKYVAAILLDLPSLTRHIIFIGVFLILFPAKFTLVSSPMTIGSNPTGLTKRKPQPLGRKWRTTISSMEVRYMQSTFPAPHSPHYR